MESTESSQTFFASLCAQLPPASTSCPSAHPPPEWSIRYNQWTYIDTVLSSEIHSLHEGSLLLKNMFIYLFLTVLGLPCCAGFSLVAASGGHSLVTVFRLLVVVTSLALGHRLKGWRASVVVAPGL